MKQAKSPVLKKQTALPGTNTLSCVGTFLDNLIVLNFYRTNVYSKKSLFEMVLGIRDLTSEISDLRSQM